MLAALFNIPQTRQDMQRFSFANADLHSRVRRAIELRSATPPDDVILDPLPEGDGLVAWMWRHQMVHNQTNALLGIAGNDLTDVDFQDQGQIASWIWLHAQEHRRACEILGLD